MEIQKDPIKAAYDEIGKKQRKFDVELMQKAIFFTCVIGLLYLAINCIITDKRNEQRNVKIFKHQVLAYLPENAAKNFPNPEAVSYAR